MKRKSFFRLREPFFFYTLLFFLLSFAGWLWEVAIYLFRDGDFINRGVLTGPWLPVYGAGGVLLALLFHRLKKHPVRVFVLSMLLCSFLEYLSGWYLETRFGIRWWDYSDSFLNLNGRICLWGSLLFGVGGAALVCLLVPALEKAYRRLCASEKGRKAVLLTAVLLLFIFVADAAWAADFPNMGKDITYPGASFT